MCYYRFDKLTPLKLWWGKKSGHLYYKRLARISAHISQIYDLAQTAAAAAEGTEEESLWLC